MGRVRSLATRLADAKGKVAELEKKQEFERLKAELKRKSPTKRRRVRK